MIGRLITWLFAGTANRSARPQHLPERVRMIVERNPLAFPPCVADPLLREVHLADAAAMKVLSESEGGGTARQLLRWDGERLSILLGSFELPDEREPATALEAPTILAWRLLEDLCVAANAIEDELLRDATLEDVWQRLGNEEQAWSHAHAWVQEALAENPQFFPSWMLEELNLGVAVVERRPQVDPEALGLFEETEAGRCIAIVLPSVLDEVRGCGRSAFMREVLLTLVHEFEHCWGSIRGVDPLADRESRLY